MVNKRVIELVNTAHNYMKPVYFKRLTTEEKFQIACALHEYGKHAQHMDEEPMYAIKNCYVPAKKIIEDMIAEGTDGGTWIQLDEYCIKHKEKHPFIERYYGILRDEAYMNFESYCYYMERYRKPEKRFYAPRKEVLHQVAMDLSNLEAGYYKFYGLSMPPRVGKSTICIFFLSWVAMKRPNSHSAMGGHSGLLAKGFYKELCNLITTKEYTFKELYHYYHPEYARKKFPTNQSAEEFSITLGDEDRFPTIVCRGIDGTWTGAVDISGGDNAGYLYVDDLIRDREHSLSPTRMENTYQEYLNKMVDRKNDGARELMVGTLWSVLDPLERTRVEHENDEVYRFRRIPALNDDDESNFQYKRNGFSSEYYRDMRDRLEDAEFQSKFQQKPYVREGLLYPKEEIRFFNGILPEGDYRTVAVVDTAFGGGDNLSMPIGREYADGSVYVFDWVYNNNSKETTIPQVVGKIIENEIRRIRFESNTDNGMYCDYVDEELQKRNYKCSCEHKRAPNTMAKTEKIIAYAGDVKRRFYFLEPNKKNTPNEVDGMTVYKRSKEYQKAMDDMMMYVTVGKNAHDDSVDSLAQLVMFLDGDGVKQTRIMRGIL